MSETVQTLRDELYNTHQKLEGYVHTVASLRGELQTLRENICQTCKQNFLPPGLVLSQPAPPENQKPSVFQTIAQSACWHLNQLMQGGYATDNSSIGVQSSVLQTETPSFQLPDPVPLNSIVPASRIASDDSEPTPPPSLKFDAPNWSVRRGTSANATLGVEFVHSFTYDKVVLSVCFSPDGKYLAVGLGDGERRFDGSVVIYETHTRTTFCELLEYPSQYSMTRFRRPAIVSVCFSPDGTYLVVGDSAHRATVWDIPTKRIRNIFKGDGPIESVNFSSNGRFVALASFKNVYIGNMRDGSGKAFHDDKRVWSVQFSPDGQHIAAGNRRGVIWIRNVRSGRLVKTWVAHQRAVNSLLYTPDGNGLLSASSDKAVKRWDVSSLGAVQPDKELAPVPAPQVLQYQGHTKLVLGASVTPDGLLIASASYDTTCILWDINSGVPQYTLTGHQDSVHSVDFSPAGIFLATGSRHHVALWKYGY